MFSSAWLRFGLLLAAMALFAVAATPVRGQEPRAYGQRLVAQYRLPADTIARYAAVAAGTALDALPRADSMFADGAPWVGPEHRAGVGHNPYTLVFTVSGAARAAGAVYAQWQAGWQWQESPIASRELLLAVPHIARTGLAAGEALTLTAASARVSFRGQRSVAPMLGLVQARNLDINEIQVQVWSGAAPQAWDWTPWTRAALLALGVACLLIGLGFTYCQRALPTPGAQPAPRGEPVRGQPGSQHIHAQAIEGERIELVAVAKPPAPATPSPEAFVLTALHQVLTLDPTAHNVADETR